MPLAAAYHRPGNVDEALALLADPNRMPLAGGTILNASRDASEIEMVDLQALGLDQITPAGDRLEIGATATLASLMESGEVPDWIREIARAEQASTLRTLATVGGAIAAPTPDSVLVAVLLVSDAQVSLAGADDRPLVALLSGGVPSGAIITSISIAVDGTGASASTGRTPADVPIVSAVARSSEAGTVMALTGVAATPVLVSPTDPTAGLQPSGDFRGSAEYRTELARILASRVEGALR